MASASASASTVGSWTVEECFAAARVIQRKLRRIYNKKHKNNVVEGEKFVLAGFAALFKQVLADDHDLRARFGAVRLPKLLTPIIFHVPPWSKNDTRWKKDVLDDPEFEKSPVIFFTPLNGWELHNNTVEVSYGLGGPYGACEKWEAIAVDQLRFGASLKDDEHNGRCAVLMVVRWAVEAGQVDVMFDKPRYSSIHEALLDAMQHVLDHDHERQHTREVWAKHLSPSLLYRAAQWEHALPRSGAAADLGQLHSAYEVLGGYLKQLFDVMATQRSLAKYEPVSRRQVGRASAFV
ncbi:hypothetical protein JCM3775_007451 [Rhodotorula graminis]